MRQNFSYISVLTQQQQLEDFDRFPRQRIHRWRSHTLKTQPFHLMTILFSFTSWWYEWLTWAFCPSANWRVVQKGLNWSLCCTVRLVNGEPRALLAKIEIECPEQSVWADLSHRDWAWATETTISLFSNLPTIDLTQSGWFVKVVKNVLYAVYCRRLAAHKVSWSQNPPMLSKLNAQPDDLSDIDIWISM